MNNNVIISLLVSNFSFSQICRKQLAKHLKGNMDCFKVFGGDKMKYLRSNWFLIMSFIVSTVLGGNNAIAVQYSNVELSPFWGGAIRLSAASILLFFIVLITRLQIPKGRAMVGALIFGVIQYGLSYALIYWSLLKVPAGMFMVVLALSPLFTFFLAIGFHQERFQWQILAGGLLSVLGIGIVFGEGLTAEVPLLSLLAIILVAVLFALAMVIFKIFPQSHPVTTNAIGMGVGGVILLAGSFMANETRVLPELPATWIAVSYLIIFGSVITFVLSFYVLKQWKASITSYQLVILPIVTIIFSSILTDEKITTTFMIGSFFVLLGVFIGAIAPKKVIHKKIPAPQKHL